MGQKQFKNVQNPELKAIIMKEDWALNNGKYRRLQCKKFFSTVTKIPKVKKIDFKANNQSTIPENLLHIHFSASLVSIDLSGNAISSLQKMCFLDMRNLEVLIFEWNFVTSLDSFRKNGFKFLQKLKIRNNPIVDFGKFQRCKNKRLKQFCLQQSSQVFQKRQTISDIIWKLAKLDCDELYSLNIGASKRIDKTTSRAFKTIKKKFTHHLSLSKST